MKRLPYLMIILIMMIPLTLSCQNNQKKADLIVYGGTIFTVDSVFSMAEAMAIRDGIVLATGSQKKIMRQYTSDHHEDLQGKYVYPGFIDAHCHFVGYGLSLQWANLVGTKSFKEVVERLKMHHNRFGHSWILGRGWDQNDWEEHSFPDRKALDEMFPDNPVMIIRVDGHGALVNQKALEIAGIHPDMNIPGGNIVTEDGRLTGMLVDNAIELVRKHIPEPSQQTLTRALQVAEKNCFAVGLTTVSDAGLDLTTLLLIDSIQKAGKLSMKIYAMLSPTEENFSTFMDQGPYQTRDLHICSVKLYADGALGSRGACLRKPYSDDPGNTGFLVSTPDFLSGICERAYKAGYQVNTHCIGDSANHLMLHMYASFLKGKNDRRWRIEHAQVISPEDFHLFGDYTIIPSVQTTHATSDMYWAEERLGPERIKGAYAYHDLLVQNGWLPNGSDFPVEDINPLLGFYAAVFRQDTTGYPPQGFQPENAISRTEALRAMTIWAAKADFEEKIKGSLEPGKQADFVVLKEDLMKVQKEEIPHIKVQSTFLNGKKVFDR